MPTHAHSYKEFVLVFLCKKHKQSLDSKMNFTDVCMLRALTNKAP